MSGFTASKEWWRKMSELEGDHEIGAGIPDEMLLNGAFKTLRNLVWAARTSGGTAGPDKGLMNACSFLYGAAARATFALGYQRIGTYILKREEGTSLAAAGWQLIGERGGGSWSVPSRPRDDKHPTEPKLLFERRAA